MLIKKIARFLWGDLSRDEFRRFGLLAVTLFFTVGAYWLLKTLKDGLFKSLIGMSYQPQAKFLSIIILVPIILLYSKLIDLYEKHKLFFILCFFYSIAFTIVAILLTHPTIGLANTEKSPYRILGWACYVLSESMGTVIIALFWSFVASSTGAESAKKGFALIISGSQLGGICGPTLATYSEYIGLPNLFLIAAGTTAIVPFMIKLFIKKFGTKKLVSVDETKSKSGSLEGLKLLGTRPYLLGIFAIATFFEIITMIVDYQMKILAEREFLTPESFTAFMGHYGQCTNIISFAMAILGTSFLMRKLGITFCLLTFPVSMGIIISLVFLSPTLWTTFVAMIAIKSLNYGLNSPTKETLYIPTSVDIRFKAKSWIDMFGSRGAKALGSGINNTFKESVPELMLYGTLIALGLVGIWIAAALFVGRKFNTLVKENKIID